MGFFNKEFKIGNTWIGENYPTYFIAEIGANFDGSIEKAKKLINEAKAAGADCAKFQTFDTPRIVSEGGFSKMRLHGVHGSWGRTVSEVFKDAEFPVAWHREIADYCTKVGIHFSTSPYLKRLLTFVLISTFLSSRLVLVKSHGWNNLITLLARGFL